VYRRFGDHGTVLEHRPQLAAREDPDVVQVEGQSGQGATLRVRIPPGDRLLEGSNILVAAGRTP